MKKIILIVTLIITIAFTACGCKAENKTELIENNGRSIYSVDILQDEILIYDINTKIVYICQYTYSGNYIYTPYLSENGFPYKYIDGELVEVN